MTSQVLNEGVDVPAANVGIILSGTGSVREHVQRLGRLLRKHGDKQALLYEVVTRGTAEEFTSERRQAASCVSVVSVSPYDLDRVESCGGGHRHAISHPARRAITQGQAPGKLPHGLITPPPEVRQLVEEQRAKYSPEAFATGPRR